LTSNALLILILYLLLTLSCANPLLPATQPWRRADLLYAPQAATCPSAALVRPADGASPGESQYVAAQQRFTNGVLSAWLRSVNTSFDFFRLLLLELACSEGGYWGLSHDAEVIQAFDSRDVTLVNHTHTSPVSGLYRAFSYHAALLGGEWVADSLVAWIWTTISY
jgi:hypothetical protein